MGTMMNATPGTGETYEVTGSVKVTNINYEQLVNNETLKTEFESTCKNRIASSASTNATTVNSSQVSLMLSPGSVVVDYVIAGLSSPTASDSVSTSLDAAISDGSLFNSLASDINAIPGIDTVAEGTIGVELNGSTTDGDDEKKSKYAKLVGFIFLTLAFLVIICCPVGIYCLACKNRKREQGMAEP